MLSCSAGDLFAQFARELLRQREANISVGSAFPSQSVAIGITEYTKFHADLFECELQRMYRIETSRREAQLASPETQYTVGADVKCFTL